MSGEVKEEKPVKWSWIQFFRSKSFMAVIFSLAVFCLWFLGVFKKTNEIVDIVVACTFAASLVFFIFSRSLETAIANIKIAAELKAGAQANINADTAKVVEAVKRGNNE
jgi:uncharacterized membrane protein YjjP (DUF1212 family)